MLLLQLQTYVNSTLVQYKVSTYRHRERCTAHLCSPGLEAADYLAPQRAAERLVWGRHEHRVSLQSDSMLRTGARWICEDPESFQDRFGYARNSKHGQLDDGSHSVELLERMHTAA